MGLFKHLYTKRSSGAALTAEERRFIDHARGVVAEGPAFIRLDFGQHRGKPLCEVPSGYLRWLVQQDFIGPRLRSMLSAYLSEPSTQEVLF